MREVLDEHEHVVLQPYATYLAGPRGIEYKQDSSGVRSWYLYDGLGSVIAQTNDLDDSGDITVTPTPATDVYGNPVTTESGSNHRFCGGLGHTTDSDTGLIYMRARYYDPAIGRFISEDPGLNGQNWYAYCGNNPINNIDATGKYYCRCSVFGVSGSLFPKRKPRRRIPAAGRLTNLHEVAESRHRGRLLLRHGDVH